MIVIAPSAAMLPAFLAALPDLIYEGYQLCSMSPPASVNAFCIPSLQDQYGHVILLPCSQ